MRKLHLDEIIALFALLIALIALADSADAQQVHPNISYSATLNGSCSSSTSSCANAVFVTGSSAMPGSTPSGPIGSGPAFDIPTTSYNAATITVSGTYSNLTLNFEFSDPTAGTNYFQEICARTDSNILEASEVVPSNTVRAWQCPAWATTRLRVRNSNASLTGTPVIWITLTEAAVDPSLVIASSTVNVAGLSDPCQDPSSLKSSAVVNISTATTTELVAAVAGKTVYFCGGALTLAGSITTADTVQFETGTKTTNPCDTSTSTRTGSFIGSLTAGVPTVLPLGSGATQFSSITAGEICAVSAGATVSIQGYISYVQQ